MSVLWLVTYIEKGALIHKLVNRMDFKQLWYLFYIVVEQHPATCLNHHVVNFRLCCFYKDVQLLTGMCTW
jgi:hypothetical protein